MEESRDQAQVGGHRRLRRQQGDQRLVYLEVAAVDPVVVGDHQLGELDVLLLDRLEGAAEGGADKVEPAERAGLERCEFLLVFDACFGHQPKRPLT